MSDMCDKNYVIASSMESDLDTCVAVAACRQQFHAHRQSGRALIIHERKKKYENNSEWSLHMAMVAEPVDRFTIPLTTKFN